MGCDKLKIDFIYTNPIDNCDYITFTDEENRVVGNARLYPITGRDKNIRGFKHRNIIYFVDIVTMELEEF